MNGLTMRASVNLDAPFTPEALGQFLATVPDGAHVDVTTRMGGSQRDPYPVGYVVHAIWKAEA